MPCQAPPIVATLAQPWSHPDLSHTPSLSIALAIGNVISFCLYGALTVQIYMYHISFPNDSKTLKANVYIIYLTETIYTILLAWDLVHLVVEPNYDACLPSLIAPIFGGLMALMTQAVYAHRIWIITQNKFISIGFVVLILMEVVVSFTLLGIGISFYVAALIWAVTCLFADATIAGIMTWSLTKEKIYSRQLRQRIGHLLQLIVGSGFLTIAVNLVTLVGASISSTSITLSSAIVLSKIYANSMMVLVNSRGIPASNDETAHGGVATLQIDTLQFGGPSSGTTTTENRLEEHLKDSFVRGGRREAEA